MAVKAIHKARHFVSLLPARANRTIWRLRLRRATPRVFPGREDLLLFACVRNDLARLPFFLQHYRAKGVDRFFFVDNDSRDGTLEFLRSQARDVCVYQTRESYAHSGYGIRWLEDLLNRYGRGRWCLLIDSDEVLIYPRWEELSIRDLCRFLSQEGRSGLSADLLDMYAKGFPSLRDGPDVPWWKLFPHFDKPFTRHFFVNSKGHLYGGVRKRVFDVDACLTKIPLFRYDRHTDISGGIHRIRGVDLSAVRGSLLHFKYDASFSAKAKAEALRQEHWSGAVEYKQYARVCAQEQDMSLYSEEYSLVFSGSRQLIDLGLMRSSDALDTFASSRLPGA